MERERYRAFHSRHPLHKADHLYNFCITSHAIKDFIFEYFKITDMDKKQLHHDVWNLVSELVAASEIANSSKHLVLRDNKKQKRIPKTKKVKNSQTSMVDVYIDETDNLHLRRRDNCPDYEIILMDETALQLHTFMNNVVVGEPISRIKVFLFQRSQMMNCLEAWNLSHNSVGCAVRTI